MPVENRRKIEIEATFKLQGERDSERDVAYIGDLLWLKSRRKNVIESGKSSGQPTLAFTSPHTEVEANLKTNQPKVIIIVVANTQQVVRCEATLFLPVLSLRGSESSVQ